MLSTLKKMFRGNKRPEVLPERNDPCWCGSGLKYKKCCIEKDRRNAQIRPRKPPNAPSSLGF